MKRKLLLMGCDWLLTVMFAMGMLLPVLWMLDVMTFWPTALLTAAASSLVFNFPRYVEYKGCCVWLILILAAGCAWIFTGGWETCR